MRIDKRIFIQFIATLLFSCTVIARTSPARINYEGNAFRLTKSRYTRWRQRCERQRLFQKVSRLNQPKQRQGSFLSLAPPTPQKVSSWFWGRGNTAPVQFNHKLVGLTNPCLQVQQEMSNIVTQQHDKAVIAASSTSNAIQKQNMNWWPRRACENLPEQWRVLRLRQAGVGQGMDCYQRVKEAALAWEFKGSSKGVQPVLSPTSSKSSCTRVLRLEHIGTAVPSALQIWNGPGRRLCTYTCLLGHRLFQINPVAVVYDVVDQAGPPGTIAFTSTAFATTRGHWLKGEERVTVVLRDNGQVDLEVLSISQPATAMGRLAWPMIGGMQRSFFQEQLKALQQVANERQSKKDQYPSAPLVNHNNAPSRAHFLFRNQRRSVPVADRSFGMIESD